MMCSFGYLKYLFGFFIALNIILLSNAYASSWYLKRTRRFSFREVKEAFKMGGLSTAVLNSV